MLFREVLEIAGYCVAEEETRAGAIRSFVEEKPDFVLLDAVMEEEDDGFKICAAMRSLAGDRTPPIVMITGLEEHDVAARALGVGATGILTKPVDIGSLVSCVEKLLATRR